MSKELKKLVADLQGNMDVVGEFMDSPQSVLDKYNVKGKERTVMLAKDSEGLNKLGFSSQLVEGALSGAHSQRCHAPI
ncbi:MULTISPECIES: hypothetical protein [Enterococcus]|uniref:hypothetical protein n=1 Tax=Enterococcus TaxID=1350 RepID=UPI0002A345BE|nr:MULTISPECIES: hypothetical protein [Enterococcus]ELA71788.1 hypothetical protein OGQ_02300 [Enterococcus faecium EnGen0017]MBK4764572.1 hypothetical protein [Enterococcus faecium]MBK4791619.1 hypothetical protein [Enterococcus faecium]MBK4799733.1 hypothetical protein [Enterococcus faecium]MBK4821167.1 hypothetical protein [Enterococcus faecium]